MGRARVKAVPWLAAGLLAVLPVGLTAQEQEVDQSELAGQGFFQDFDELDLESLLESNEVEASLADGRLGGVDRAAGSVSILTRDELLNLGAHTLEEALVMLPGVDVQRDGLGRSRISVRGLGGRGLATASAELLVLYNGARLDEPLTGGASSVNLDMPIDDVERLELLRGPASALYGSGAMAGVVLITTRLGDAQSAIEVSAGAGSFDTQRYHVRVSSVSGDLRISGFIYFLDAGGPELLVPRDAQTFRDRSAATAPVSLAPGLADTGLRAVETNYRLGFRDLELSLRYKRELGGNFAGTGDALGERGDLDDKQVLLDLSWRRELAGGDLVARLGYHDTTRFEVQSPAPPGFTIAGDPPVRFPAGVVYQSRLQARRLGAEATFDRELGLEHRLLAGAALGRESSIDPEQLANFDFLELGPLPDFQVVPGLAEERSRSVLGIWVQDTWTRHPWTLTGGLRLDHFGGTGATLSPRLAAVWELPSGTFLKALYGRSFRVPTLAELYFDLPGFRGDPDLEPPRYDSLELAAWRRLGNLRLTGSAFLGFLRDPITTAAPATPLAPQPLVNGAGTDIRGFEVDVLREFGVADSITGSYTYQHAEDVASGGRAAGIPSHLVSLGATLHFGRHLTVAPSLLRRSGLPREAGDPRAELGGVTLVNVSLRVIRLHRSLELGGVVRNLFDETWFDPAPILGLPDDYPRPGISVLLHARYTF
jgi:iron complex outermembrane receptor protein